jgi:hypothetical protein
VGVSYQRAATRIPKLQPEWTPQSAAQTVAARRHHSTGTLAVAGRKNAPTAAP